MADLNFKQRIGIVSAASVNLEFVPQPPPADLTATLGMVKAAPVLSISAAGVQVSAVLQVTLSAPVLSVTADYDNRLSQLVSNSIGAAYQDGAGRDVAKRCEYQTADLSRKAWRDVAQQAKTLTDNTESDYQQSEQLRVADAASWQDGERVSDGVRDGFNDLDRAHWSKRGVWQDGVPVSRLSADQFIQLLFTRVRSQLPYEIASRLNAGSIAGLHQVAEWLDTVTWIPWERAVQPKFGKSPPLKPVKPKPPEHVPDTNLNFVCDVGLIRNDRVDLNFATGQSCPMVKRKVYIVSNEIYCKRLSDDAPIQLLSCQVGIDRDSFAWSFSASVPYTEVDKVAPTVDGMTEIELGINGIIWRFVVENYGKRSQFAKTDVTIGGRSLTAYLTEPYAAKRDYNHSAASFATALADAELNRGGEVSGFELDWQLIDDLGWAVPANTLNYQGLTPLQAIQKIAAAGGGFVQSHPSEPTVMVVPDYPIASWHWASATPNKIILPDLVKSESLQWQEKPAYNGVYVEGVTSGVVAFVKRTGTAGENQAETFVDRMTCDQAAARQKGLSILSEGGKQARMSIDLPMHNSIGLLLPSMLIEVSGQWRGLVRGVSISVQQKGLSITQSVDVERHY